ncbi:MAG: response regulator [Sphingomonas sp.]
MAAVRVLIVDDSLTIRAMLEQVLGRERDIVLVGTARDADSAMRMVREHRPDVTTIDIAMPGTDGLALLDAVRAKTNAVMLSNRSEAADESFARGALGFFDKPRILSDSKRLVRMVHAAAAGKRSRRPAAPAI